MRRSRRIAGLLGPALIAIITSELPFVQPDLYSTQIPPVVYLSGALLFVAGLAIVRSHNRWNRNWTVLVTVSGWLSLALGLVRMFGASTYLNHAASTPTALLTAIELALLACGIILTYQALRPSS